MLGAMLYVLRTGMQWNALPRELGASTTVYDRFRFWLAAGFFQRLWAAGLQEFDELVGIEWEWQSLDGALTKAPRTRRDRRGGRHRAQSDGSRQARDQAQHGE
jgi:putative transposase